MNTSVHRLIASVLSMAACTEAFADATRAKQLIQSMIGTVGALYYTTTTIFVLIGIGITWKSLVGLYRLSEGTQQRSTSATGCIVGLLVGGALTTIGVVAVMVANTLES